MKGYTQIEHSVFDDVHIINHTPHCIKHGAMNKVSKHDDGGGYWRCISVVNSKGNTVCRTGCCEKIIKDEKEPIQNRRKVIA